MAEERSRDRSISSHEARGDPSDGVLLESDLENPEEGTGFASFLLSLGKSEETHIACK